jgi:uncharacterized membrane protein YeiB
VEGRFYPIFAFLFGVGMTVFLTNAERRGDRRTGGCCAGSRLWRRSESATWC